jgi:hypothetical protein
MSSFICKMHSRAEKKIHWIEPHIIFLMIDLKCFIVLIEGDQVCIELSRVIMKL